MTSLLITRPAAQAREFLDAVTAGLGRTPAHVLAPLSRIEPLSPEPPGSGDLVFTSGRAVELAGDLTGRRAFCVGDRTAALARAAGAEAISAGPEGGEVGALLALLVRMRPERVTHMRGEDSAGALVARLRAARIDAGERIAYRALRLPLAQEARDLLLAGTPVLAPVFSPRGARFLAGDAPRMPDHVVAISAAAARPFDGRCSVATVPAPDGASMLQAVLRRLGNLS